MSRITCLAVCLTVLLLSVPASASAEQAPAPGRPAAATAAAPLNLNTATQAQLEALPGVGASTAQRIVEHRQKNGPFKKIEELMNIKGIGEKSFLKLKPLITVSAEKEKAGGLE